jgi:hypothetical protein
MISYKCVVIDLLRNLSELNAMISTDAEYSEACIAFMATGHNMHITMNHVEDIHSNLFGQHTSIGH